MSEKIFAASRPDGRSDAVVIIDFVRRQQPGAIVPYYELQAALQEGTDREFDVQAVQHVVSRTCNRMLRELCRTLICVPRQGYRVSLGSEHSSVARVKEDRARSQRAKALLALNHVHWDELDANQRLLHEAHLMLTATMCAQMDAMERRQARSEKAIRDLKKRVDQQGK